MRPHISTGRQPADRSPRPTALFADDPGSLPSPVTPGLAPDVLALQAFKAHEIIRFECRRHPIPEADDLVNPLDHVDARMSCSARSRIRMSGWLNRQSRSASDAVGAGNTLNPSSARCSQSSRGSVGLRCRQRGSRPLLSRAWLAPDGPSYLPSAHVSSFFRFRAPAAGRTREEFRSSCAAAPRCQTRIPSGVRQATPKRGDRSSDIAEEPVVIRRNPRISDALWALAVLPTDVVNVADRWPVPERAVGPAPVVVADE
jgi:hypothetical protein